MDTNRLAELLGLWMLAVLIIVLAQRFKQSGTSGLTAAYVFDLWLIHWLAPCFYLLPWYRRNDPRWIEAGLEQSLYGIAAFAFGSIALAPFFLRMAQSPRNPDALELDRNLPVGYVTVGVIFYALLTTALGSLPTATAIIATGQQLIVVGVGLCCWQAWRDGDRRRFTLWMGAALCFPLVTIMTRGFIGYGAGATVCVLLFISSFIRSRVRVVAWGLVIGYLGLSIFATYMRDRSEIRASVWGGESYTNRVDRIAATAGSFEWFDIRNQDHLSRLDDRLNQNVLVGAAVTRMSEMGGFAHGETLWNALLALVPRMFWPDKPIEAGSGTIVSEYTGIAFAPGTSIGIGHVMEFYINFGTWGVIIGFTIIGVLVTLLDIASANRLANADLHGFVLWYLPGISLLQVGGSMIEVTSSAAASLFVAFVANKYLDRLQQNKAGRAAAAGYLGGKWSDQSAQ